MQKKKSKPIYLTALLDLFLLRAFFITGRAVRAWPPSAVTVNRIISIKKKN